MKPWFLFLLGLTGRTDVFICFPSSSQRLAESQILWVSHLLTESFLCVVSPLNSSAMIKKKQACRMNMWKSDVCIIQGSHSMWSFWRKYFVAFICTEEHPLTASLQWFTSSKKQLHTSCSKCIDVKYTTSVYGKYAKGDWHQSSNTSAHRMGSHSPFSASGVERLRYTRNNAHLFILFVFAVSSADEKQTWAHHGF